MAETLAQIETELGQTMTIADDPAVYPCVVGERADTKELGIGGFAGGSAVEVVCRRNLFTESTLPTVDDDLYLNFKAHKIVSVVISPDGALVVMQCDDVNKDA